MERKYQIILIGGHCVGKTSFITRYLSNKMSKQPIPTQAIQTVSKIIPYENIQFLIQFKDTPSQKLYRMLVKPEISKATAIIAMFDMSKKQTLVELSQFWIPTILSQTKKLKNAPIIIIFGNKKDKVRDEQKLKEIFEATDKIRQEIDSFFFCGSIKENDEALYQVMDKIFYFLSNNVEKQKQYKKKQDSEEKTQINSNSQNPESKKGLKSKFMSFFRKVKSQIS